MSPEIEQLRGVQGLATFESPDLGAALSAAADAARSLVDPQHWGADTYTAAPEGAKWTAEELQEQLLYQQAYEPQGSVRVVIIAYAHLMDARLHDHLLKIVEEPSAPVLFLFVVDDGDRLPVTLQSRIYRRVRVEPRSLEGLTQEIRDAGGSTPPVGVVRLSQLSPLLSAAATGESAAKVSELASVFVAALKGHGFTDGFRATKALKQLAKEVSGAGSEAPKTKAAQRELLRGGLQLLKSLHLHVLETGSTEQAEVADSRLSRVGRAQRLAESHLPPDQVFAYALSGGAREA